MKVKVVEECKILFWSLSVCKFGPCKLRQPEQKEEVEKVKPVSLVDPLSKVPIPFKIWSFLFTYSQYMRPEQVVFDAGRRQVVLPLLSTSLCATPDVTILPPLPTNTSFAGRCLSDQNPMLLAQT